MKPFISVCTIFKNEEFFMKEFIESYLHIADEFILVDTGSTDKSIDIIKSFGIKPYYFKWINDFGKARTHSLSLANGTWICVADVDDRISKKNALEMKNYLQSCSSHGVISPYVNLNNFDWKNLPHNILSTHDRMVFFKNHLGIDYRGAIHENPMISIEENNYQLAHHHTPIYHLGYAEELLSKKTQRNKKIIEDLYDNGVKEPHIIYHYCNLHWGKSNTIYINLKEALKNSKLNRKYTLLESLCYWIYDYQKDNKHELASYLNELHSIKKSSKVLILFQAREAFDCHQVNIALSLYQSILEKISELSSRYKYEIHYRVIFLLAANNQLSKALFYADSFDEYLQIIDFFHLKVKLLTACNQFEKVTLLLKKLPSRISYLESNKLQELKLIAQHLNIVLDIK
ncbi:MAG: hypothetical protein COB02_08655 [Candidatus Cloacimonadota bacterium]|nr:MAG: hypothetical protein COB02_08655 [Candidatus Cloacimonadota bacterium]